jgi:hypothetical protein
MLVQITIDIYVVQLHAFCQDTCFVSPEEHEWHCDCDICCLFQASTSSINVIRH